MLSGDFFTSDNIEQAQGRISASINLNTSHPIYQGHFPGMPIVPGVCQIEIVKEILCTSLKGSFMLSESKVCKFINMINPNDVNDLKCIINLSELTDKSIQFSAELIDSNRTYFKIKGGLIKENG